MNKIQETIEQIRRLEKELSEEIQKKEEEFFYKIKGKKVYFEQAVKQKHKKLVTGIATYIASAPIMTLISTPIIWSCLVPALFMDMVISAYQFICFRIYKIPRVNRNDFIVMDRHALSYLNLIEKINCVYCGYFNGVISYTQEVAARTEQYWCPIKHARKINSIHSRYGKFLEYGDAKEYKKLVEIIRHDFADLQ